MKDFEARLWDGPDSFSKNVVTLLVRDQRAYLMQDGSWQQVPEGKSIEGAGIELPRGSIEAIAIAIQEWQGHTSHADTEARVLREWLAVERARVERALDR